MYAKPTNRNYYLNFLKGIGCIGVVFIHIRFPGEFGKAIHKLAQFAVPVFLLISGFYAFSNTTEKLYIKCKRIGLITLYAISAYFLFYFALHLYNHTFTEYFYKLISLKNIGKMLLLQDLSSVGGFHLWFLPSLLLCYLFQMIIETINRKMFWIVTPKSEVCDDSSGNKLGSNLIVILLIVFLVIHLIISVCKDSNYIIWNLKATFLGSGIFWFLLGNYIACKKEDIINYLPERKLFLYLVVFFSGAVAVTLNYFTPNFSEFAIVMYSALLFLLAIKNPTVHISKAFEFIGDKLSLNVYILHIMINLVVSKIISKFDFAQSTVYLSVKPLVIVFISLIVSYFLYRLTKMVRVSKQQSGN